MEIRCSKEQSFLIIEIFFSSFEFNSFFFCVSKMFVSSPLCLLVHGLISPLCLNIIVNRFNHLFPLLINSFVVIHRRILISIIFKSPLLLFFEFNVSTRLERLGCLIGIFVQVDEF